MAANLIFLSTLPARGATCTTRRPASPPDFYPRSPRGERRRRSRPSGSSDCDFYPRSPRGERPAGRPPASSAGHFYPRSPRGERPERSNRYKGAQLKFLSTLPARGATRCCIANRPNTL